MDILRIGSYILDCYKGANLVYYKDRWRKANIEAINKLSNIETRRDFIEDLAENHKDKDLISTMLLHDVEDFVISLAIDAFNQNELLFILSCKNIHLVVYPNEVRITVNKSYLKRYYLSIEKEELSSCNTPDIIKIYEDYATLNGNKVSNELLIVLKNILKREKEVD